MTTIAARSQVAPPGGAAAVRAGERLRLTGPLLLLYFAWVLAVMEPDWFLTANVGGPFYRLPTLIGPVLLIIALARHSRRALYWPFLIFVVLHLGYAIFALNSGFAREPFKFLLHMYFLFAATTVLVDTPAKLALLFKIYLLGFLWYAIQGLPHGRVSWHPLLANEDSFGPLMGMAVGFGYYYAQSIRGIGWKVAAYSLCGMGLFGVVAANARGAVVAAGLVLFMVWIRSPRKLATLGAGLVAAVLSFVAIETIFPSGAFWEEMSTISAGASQGTGQARLEMWKMAWPVFLESPLVGVGAANFGVMASEIIEYDPSRAQLQDPNLLYSLQLHNVFVQIFCETGLIGLGCFLYMLVVFVRQLRFLRSRAVVRAWRRYARGAPDVRFLSLALELAMIAYLANAFFYNQTYIHWFWTLSILAYASSEVATRTLRRSRSLQSRAASPVPASDSPPAAGLGRGLLSHPGTRPVAGRPKP